MKLVCRLVPIWLCVRKLVSVSDCLLTNWCFPFCCNEADWSISLSEDFDLSYRISFVSDVLAKGRGVKCVYKVSQMCRCMALPLNWKQ